MRIDFDVVSLRAERNLKCPDCGKRFRRTQKFTQTINPWNTTTDGAVKDRGQIMTELRAESASWKPEHGCKS